jgi:hypothetical protein
MGGTYNMSMIGLLVGVHIFLTFFYQRRNENTKE